MEIEKNESNESYLGGRIKRQLESLKRQINKNERTVKKPGDVTYLRDSTDKKYYIYGYKLLKGGNKGGIRRKFIDQIGRWIKGTQFVDVNGNELKKDRFEANEVVYLRVPKQGIMEEKKKESKENVNKRQESVETKGMPKGLALDHGTYVYTVQPGDNESVIKQKLSRYAPLSYLKTVKNDIRGWNFGTIPDTQLLPGLKIPVPKKDSEKLKTISDFKASQRVALNEMKSHPTYGNKIMGLIKKFGEDYIARVMTAYAMCESSPENANRLGEFAFFRYESTYKCASYGYHHILWEKQRGIPAFKNTGLSIGQSCNPKDSGKVFLAFCMEKGGSNYRKFFDIKNNLDWAAFNYNGPGYKRNNYDKHLINSFNRTK